MKPDLSSRSSRSQANWHNFVSVVLGFAILLMVNYLSFRYYVRKDWSETHFYELSPKTIQILKSLDAPVKIIVYSTSTDRNPARIKIELDNLLKEYKFRGRDKIVIERVDPALNMMRAEEVAKKYNFLNEDNVVVFEYKDRNRTVKEDQMAEFENGVIYGSEPRMKSFRGETEFTAAIQSLVEGKPAKIYFLQGHGEWDLDDSVNPEGLGAFVNHLKHENIEVAKLNLVETPDVPADAEGLVIAGPRVSLSIPETTAISAYLDKKGKVALLEAPKTTSGLEALAQKYGMKIDNDIVLAKIAELGSQYLTQDVLISEVANHPITSTLVGYNIIFSGARSISDAGKSGGEADAKVTQLLRTPAGYWGETDLNNTKAVYDASKDVAGPLTIAAVYDGGEIPGESVKVAGTRFLIVGSSTFITNRYLDGRGIDFFTNGLNWMLKRDTAIGISPKVPQEYPLNVTPAQAARVSWLACLLFPLIALITGLVIWYTRRK